MVRVTSNPLAQVLAILAAGALMMMAFFAAPTLAAHGPAGAPSGTWNIQPEFVDGNRTCGFFGYEHELKVEPVTAGAHSDGDGRTVTISNIHNPGGGQLFDWSSNTPVDAVFVKGGPGGNLYEYDPARLSDTLLHSPVNPNNHTYYGLSHISFCFGEGVPQGDPLQIEKTVDASVAYEWTIEKTVDGDDRQTGDPGSTVTFGYLISVEHDGGDFALSGEITVFNPNADLTVEGVVVTDEIFGADFGEVGAVALMACDVTPPVGFDGTIDSLETLVFDYECEVTDDSAEVNVATVAWDESASASTELDEGDASAVELITWDSIDDCIDVFDDMGTPADTTDDVFLGEVCVGDDNPTVFNHSIDYTVPATGCVEFTNTASFITNTTGTEDSDTATVTVCADLEGCTPGFWKNHSSFGPAPYDAWGPTGYTPTDNLNVFGANALNGSLLDGLNFGGGPGVNGAKQILLRAAVAALLNAAHPDVSYALSEADVISQVTAALGSNRPAMLALAATLDEANNAGCPDAPDLVGG